MWDFIIEFFFVLLEKQFLDQIPQFSIMLFLVHVEEKKEGKVERRRRKKWGGRSRWMLQEEEEEEEYVILNISYLFYYSISAPIKYKKQVTYLKSNRSTNLRQINIVSILSILTWDKYKFIDTKLKFILTDFKNFIYHVLTYQIHLPHYKMLFCTYYFFQLPLNFQIQMKKEHTLPFRLIKLPNNIWINYFTFSSLFFSSFLFSPKLPN